MTNSTPTGSVDELREEVTKIVALMPMGTDAKLTEIGWERYMENEQEAIESLMQLILARENDAQIALLNRLCDMYNLKFEPNGEFVPFGKLKPDQIADFFLSVGQELRRLQSLPNTTKEG